MSRPKKLLLVAAVLLTVVVAVVALLVPARVDDARNPITPHDPYPVSARARDLHETLRIGDWHADSLLWTRDLTERNTRGHVDFPRLRAGNVALQVLTTVTKSPANQNYEQNSADAMDNITLLAVASAWPPRTWSDLTERALYQADRLEGFIDDEGGRVRLVRGADDLDAVLRDRADGRDVTGVLLGIEGAHALEGELANLDRLEAAGFRVIGLQHFFDNALGTSLHGRAEGGLTDFGREVVREVEARGMVLDLAHSSPAVVRDVLSMTDMPLVVSHTGLKSHCEVTRNIPDALMVAIAQTGGTIGIGYWSDVLCSGDAPADVAATIAAAIEVVGEDHVSLGSDYDGAVQTGFDVAELPALTHALLAQGLSEAQIAKVMGGNMVRVLRARLR